MLLSLNATPCEAAWPAYTATFRQALGSSNMIGLVSIPGMMTGQILGGSSPKTATDYQIVITVRDIGESTLLKFICDLICIAPMYRTGCSTVIMVQLTLAALVQIIQRTTLQIAVASSNLRISCR